MQRPAQILVALFVGTVAAATATAHSPVEFLEVFQVEPADRVDHAVDLKSVYDDHKQSTAVVGPRRFSQAVGCLDRRQKEPRAFLSWYKISDPKTQPERTVSVLDLVRGGENMDLVIGDAEFFLNPAQSIATGKPDPTPEGLDQYKAFKVINAASLDRELELVDNGQKESRKVLRPIFVCIAVEEWHHDEYFEASHQRACFVVYQLDSKPSDKKFNTIDQFGLNQLRASSSQWLCVRGTLLDSGKK